MTYPIQHLCTWAIAHLANNRFRKPDLHHITRTSSAVILAISKERQQPEIITLHKLSDKILLLYA